MTIRDISKRRVMLEGRWGEGPRAFCLALIEAVIYDEDGDTAICTKGGNLHHVEGSIDDVLQKIDEASKRYDAEDCEGL